MSDQQIFANIVVLRAEGITPKVPAKFEPWMPASSVVELAKQMRLGVPDHAAAHEVSLWKVKDDWRTRQLSLDQLREAAEEVPLSHTLEVTLPNNILSKSARVPDEWKELLYLVVVYKPRQPGGVDLGVD